jgi:hypothetical protein
MRIKSKISGFTKFKWITEGFLFLSGFIALYSLDWPQLRFWRVKGPGGQFEDLQGILVIGDCFKYIGNDVFKDNGGCTGYMYGKFLLQTFNVLHIREEHYRLFGFVLLVLLSFSLAFLFRAIDFKFNILFKLAIVFSPPIVLLAERGNFDIVIFLLVLLSATLFVRNLPELALIPILAASLMKFYTLPSLFAIAILRFRNTTRLVALIAATYASYLILQDLGRIAVGFRQFWYAQFGMSVWGRYINEVGFFQLNETTINLLGIIIFGLTIYIVSRSSRIPKDVLSSDNSAYQAKNITFLLLFSTHIACFSLGMSYDYRLIFIVGATGALLSSNCKLSDQQKRMTVALLTSLVWCSYNSGQLQIVGNVALEFLTAWYLLVTYNHLRNFVRKAN